MGEAGLAPAGDARISLGARQLEVLLIVQQPGAHEQGSIDRFGKIETVKEKRSGRCRQPPNAAPSSGGEPAVQAHYLSQLVGLGLLAALISVALTVSPLALSTAAMRVLVIVAIWETRSLGRAMRRA
jgi:hypothetical protein